MAAVIFSTPGLIDLRAFTVMGFNSKPTKPNPIGFFGTGLKYAMAVLCRMGAKPVVYVGRDKYTFFTKKVDFRGKEFEQIWMRSEKFKLRARNIQLPYTTEYGKNWKPWMVFRELESNTRDENGSTDLDQIFDQAHFNGIDGETTIVVEGDYLIEPYEQRAKLFLDDKAHPPRVQDHTVCICDGESSSLYYRGVRAKDVARPTLYTYDFLITNGLTEDRTFESEFWTRWTLGIFVAGCTDENVIERIITADKNHWEHELEIPESVQPSRAFMNVMMKRPRAASSAAYSYYRSHVDEPETSHMSPWELAPRPWRLDGDDVLDAQGNYLFRKPSAYIGRWAKIAEELIRVANMYTKVPDERPEASDEVPGERLETEPETEEPEPTALTQAQEDADIPIEFACDGCPDIDRCKSANMCVPF